MGPTVAPVWHGAPVDAPVIAMSRGEYEIRLPTRPNGSSAWIAAAGVPLSYTPYRIVINLHTRRLTLYKNGVETLQTPAGIGTAADPTPTGHFFVAFFAAAPSPAWGPFIMVTSAHSVAISDWEESGDAVVAIHGPLGDDAVIGTTGALISHGCVRLHVADLVELRPVPAGSPVDIVA
jgi:lipoprotein-anchoring transpeptidase ErfK/SrfK